MKDLDYQNQASTAVQPPATSGRAPGKTTRTQHLPARKQKEPDEIEMTGIPLLDEGLACDGKEGKTDGCFLDPRAAGRLEDMLRTAANAYCLAMLAALGNVVVYIRTKHKGSWGPIQEVIFFAVTSAIIGPLAGMGASAAARAAVQVAFGSNNGLAWKAAAVLDNLSASRISSALTLFSKGMRNAFAHPPAGIPLDHIEFVQYLQDQVPGFTENIMQGVAEQRLDHREMLELLARFNDPEITSRAKIQARTLELLNQFDLNRIGSIGNVMDLGGGYKVAEPIKVKLRKKEYWVLCESLGTHHSALALNGANMDLEPGVPEMTMESLIYVRVIEESFRPMVASEFKSKRKTEIETIDFDDRAARRRHRWFPDFYRDVKKHHLEDYVDSIHAFGSPSVPADPDHELLSENP